MSERVFKWESECLCECVSENIKLENIFILCICVCVCMFVSEIEREISILKVDLTPTHTHTHTFHMNPIQMTRREFQKNSKKNLTRSSEVTTQVIPSDLNRFSTRNGVSSFSPTCQSSLPRFFGISLLSLSLSMSRDSKDFDKIRFGPPVRENETFSHRVCGISFRLWTDSPHETETHHLKNQLANPPYHDSSAFLNSLSMSGDSHQRNSKFRQIWARFGTAIVSINVVGMCSDYMAVRMKTFGKSSSSFGNGASTNRTASQ